MDGTFTSHDHTPAFNGRDKLTKEILSKWVFCRLPASCQTWPCNAPQLRSLEVVSRHWNPHGCRPKAPEMVGSLGVKEAPPPFRPLEFLKRRYRGGFTQRRFQRSANFWKGSVPVTHPRHASQRFLEPGPTPKRNANSKEAHRKQGPELEIHSEARSAATSAFMAVASTAARSWPIELQRPSAFGSIRKASNPFPPW